MPKVARRGCSSGSKSVLSQDNPKTPRGMAFSFSGWGRPQGKMRCDDNLPRSKTSVVRRNYLDEAPKLSSHLLGNRYYFIHPQTAPKWQGMEAGAVALQPAYSLTRHCQRAGVGGNETKMIAPRGRARLHLDSREHGGECAASCYVPGSCDRRWWLWHDGGLFLKHGLECPVHSCASCGFESPPAGCTRVHASGSRCCGAPRVDPPHPCSSAV